MKRVYAAGLLAIGLAVVPARAGDAKTEIDAKAVYTSAKCALCHGQNGKGETKAGQKSGVQDFTDAKYQTKLKDDEMFKAIKEGLKKGGKPLMQPYASKLTDPEIKALVAYVRTFKK